MFNNKGQINALFMFAIIIMVVIVGAIVLVIGSAIVTYTGDTINDVTSNLGMSGTTNLSHASDVSIGVVNKTVQSLKFGSGLLLFFALLGILMFAASIRLNPNGFMIGLYLFMVIIFIITAMFMSNTYESFLSGTDDIAMELKSMTIASFLLLWLPEIVTVISFIGGIIIFTGLGDEMQ